MNQREHERILALLPPGDYEAVYLYDDGTIDRDPLVGWALVETWMCPQQFRCEWDRCEDADYHSDRGTEIKPVIWVDGAYTEVGMDVSNGAVMAKKTTDEMARTGLGAAAQREKEFRARRIAARQAKEQQ
jgi:hypothetical protein